MEHDLFKPKTLEEGQHTVVGDCNGFPMKQRWEEETPLFAKQISHYIEDHERIKVLDYGCGVGRIAKEVLRLNPHIKLYGLDASVDELALANQYVANPRFTVLQPHHLNEKMDVIYCVYCLQHVPAIEIREVLQRIHTFLKDDGVFIYCSSDYRMAIRFDGGGFFDDRFLGVDLRQEIGRLFREQGDLFPLDGGIVGEKPPEIIRKMIYGENGGLAHPAKVYRKKKIEGHLFNARALKEEVKVKPSEDLPAVKENPLKSKKLLLRNRLSPGDVLVMTVAIRSLKKKHGDHFEIEVESPANFIFENNPYITKHKDRENVQVIDMQYPEIHKSGASGRHFVDGHRKYLEEVLDVECPRVGLLPDIFLNQDEKAWPSPVLKELGYTGKYWVLNAGSKNDYPLKQYHRWQEVVNLWNEKNPDIKIVQIGQLVKDHNHPPLAGVLDMRGKTEGRKLFRTIFHAEGVLSCVSFPMHIAAALEKPCVVVAGGREGTRWELYPNHRFLYTNGALDCCLYDGCWKSKIEECQNIYFANGAYDVRRNNRVPLCHELIRPEDVVRAMELYYLGGALKKEVVYG